MIACPHCHAPIADAPELAGERVSCPTCEGEFQLPPLPPEGPRELPLPHPVIRQRFLKPRAPTRLPAVITLAVLGVVAAGAVAFFAFPPRSQTLATTQERLLSKTMPRRQTATAAVTNVKTQERLLSKVSVTVVEPTTQQLGQFYAYLPKLQEHIDRWNANRQRAEDEYQLRLEAARKSPPAVDGTGTTKAQSDAYTWWNDELARIDGEEAATRPNSPLPHGVESVLLRITNNTGYPVSRVAFRVRRMADGRSVAIHDWEYEWKPIGGLENGETKDWRRGITERQYEEMFRLGADGRFDSVRVDVVAIYGAGGELIAIASK